MLMLASWTRLYSTLFEGEERCTEPGPESGVGEVRVRQTKVTPMKKGVLHTSEQGWILRRGGEGAGVAEGGRDLVGLGRGEIMAPLVSRPEKQ